MSTAGLLKPASPPPPPAAHRESYDDADGDNNGQVVLYASRLELTLENQNLKSLLDSMHWRVMELEKVCSRMKTQMTKMKASRRGGGAAGCQLKHHRRVSEVERPCSRVGQGVRWWNARA